VIHPGTATYDGEVSPEIADAVRERLLKERVVLVHGEIDNDMANQVTAQLLLLDAEDPGREISMYINTPGGSVPAGMSIWETMRLVKCDVATCAMGLAGGMGLVLLAAGTWGRRHALSHARLLLLQPTGSGSTADPMASEVFDRWRREISQILADATGKTSVRVREDWEPQRWFTADEGLEYGFVDRVLEPGTRIKPRRQRA
jgi:ATP-dependent Clp protease protease subunit